MVDLQYEILAFSDVLREQTLQSTCCRQSILLVPYLHQSCAGQRLQPDPLSCQLDRGGHRNLTAVFIGWHHNGSATVVCLNATGHRVWHAEVGTEMVLTNRPAKHYYNTISADISVILHELKQLIKVINKSPEEQNEKSSTKIFSLGL